EDGIRDRNVTGVQTCALPIFIVAPWLFQFSDVKAAKWAAIIIGIVGVLSELTSTSPSSPMKLVPMRVHLGMDVVLGLILALSPWLFGISDEKLNAWLPHLIVGILIIGYALMTRPDDAVVPNRPAHEAPPTAAP